MPQSSNGGEKSNVWEPGVRSDGHSLSASRIGPDARHYVSKAPRTGRIAATFEGGLMLLFDDEGDAHLITVHDPAIPLHPWSIELRDLPPAVEGMNVQSGSGTIMIDGELLIELGDAQCPPMTIPRLPPDRSSDARQSIERTFRETADRMDGRDSEMLGTIERWQDSHRPRVLLELVGRGEGSTPLGDDILVGILAGQAASGVGPSFSQAVSAEEIRARTTLGSWQMITSASAGHFPEPLCLLAEALANEGRGAQAEAMRRLLQIGASSGAGMLVGFATGLTTVG